MEYPITRARRRSARTVVLAASILLFGGLLTGCTGSPDPAPVPSVTASSAAVLPTAPEAHADTVSGDAPLSIINASYNEETNTIEVNGVISDRTILDGRCSLTVLRQSDGATETFVAGAPASAVTFCRGMRVELPTPATGRWEFSLAYGDSTSSGNATGIVDVP